MINPDRRKPGSAIWRAMAIGSPSSRNVRWTTIVLSSEAAIRMKALLRREKNGVSGRTIMTSIRIVPR
jgi:hypothetical protein